MDDSIHLRFGDQEVALAPALGGAVLHFRSIIDGEIVDWLRPASADAIAQGDPLGAACFPLVPYSNRVRAGRFAFAGQRIELPLNFGDHPHSIHGHGWQAPWRIIASTKRSASLAYHHVADAWPFDYTARQHFALDDGGLTVTLELTAEGPARMPAGLGLHPYFPRTPETRIHARVGQVWRVDDEVMPLERVRPTVPCDPNRGIAADRVALDNVFTGWDGSAVIEWPERRARLRMTADRALGFLVVFTPKGEDFLCVEPVSHATDAFNLAAAGAGDTGMRVLESGQSLSASVRFTPERGL